MSLDPRPQFPPQLQLKDLIRQVKAEISAAVQENLAKAEKPMFRLSGVTLEVNFVIENEQSAEGSFSAKLFAIVTAKAGAKVKYSSEQVHKVTIQLDPYEEEPAQEPPKAVEKEGGGSGSGGGGGGGGGGGRHRGGHFMYPP